MKKNNNKRNNIFSLIVLIIALILVFMMPTKNLTHKHYKTSEITNFNVIEDLSKEMTYQEFSEKLKNNEIEAVYAEFNEFEYSNTMFVTIKDDTNVYMVQNPNNDTFKKDLLENGVDVKEKSYVFDVTDYTPSVSSAADRFSRLVSLFSFALTGFMVYFIFIMLKKQG